MYVTSKSVQGDGIGAHLIVLDPNIYHNGQLNSLMKCIVAHQGIPNGSCLNSVLKYSK